MNIETTILKVREISHGIVELRADNILVFRPDLATFKNYNLIVLEDLLEVFIEITDGIPRPYLCDNKYITGITSKEEQVYINENMSKFATKAAMITNSSLINFLVNSYISFFKPKIALKLFTTENAAVEWLLMD